MALWDFFKTRVQETNSFEPVGISVWNRKGRNGARMIPSIHINELIELASRTWKTPKNVPAIVTPTSIIYGSKTLGKLRGWSDLYETPKLIVLGDYSLKVTHSLLSYEDKVEIFVQAFPLTSMGLNDSEVIWVYGEIANLLLYELAQAISTANDTPEDIHSAALDLLKLLPSSDSVITNKLLDKISNDLESFKLDK